MNIAIKPPAASSKKDDLFKLNGTPPLASEAAAVVDSIKSGAVVAAGNAGDDNPGAMCSELDPSNPDGLNYDPNDTSVWVIPAQSEIEIGALGDGSILIFEPPGPGTQSEGERITVAPRNVVAFARRVLWAAGFRGVLIATGSGGGYSDLLDGSVPDDFENGGK